MAIRKYILLALLLCVMASSASAEIPNRLDSLIAYMKLGVYGTTTVDNTTDAELTSYLNRSLNNALKVGGVEKLDTVFTNDSTALYALNTDFDDLSWCVKFKAKSATDNAPATIYPLDRAPNVRSADSLWNLRQGPPGAKNTKSTDEKPRFVIVFSDQVMFYPQPADSNLIIIGYTATHPKLAAAADSLIVNERLREAVVQGAIDRWKTRLGIR